MISFVRSSSAEKEPEQLERLRVSWIAAKKDATDPIDRKYLDALSKLKIMFTKSGELQKALAVEAEISSISTIKEDQSESLHNQVFDKLVSSTCKWDDGTLILFNKDGTITSPHSDWLGPFHIRENGDLVIKHRSINREWVFRFDKGQETARSVRDGNSIQDRKK